MLGSGELLEIRFGTVFTANTERPLGLGSKRVVVRLGNDHCASTDVYLTLVGEEALIPTGIGTTGRIHIGEVVGYWDLDKVLRAFKVGYLDRGMERIWGMKENDLTNRLREESKKQPILLGRSVPQL